jgi:hypothetical protein
MAILQNTETPPPHFFCKKNSLHESLGKMSWEIGSSDSGYYEVSIFLGIDALSIGA